MVPPVTRTARRATRTENTLVHPIQLAAILGRLEELALCRRVVVFEEWLNGLVLLVEECEVRYEVFDDVHCAERHLVAADVMRGEDGELTVWQRVDFCVF